MIEAVLVAGVGAALSVTLTDAEPAVVGALYTPLLELTLPPHDAIENVYGGVPP